MLKLNITADQDSDFVPDYEEVDPVQVQQLRQSLRRHSMHKDMIFHHNVNFRNESLNKSMEKNNSHNETASSTTTERIMQSLIYCIHKVSRLIKKNTNLGCFLFSLYAMGPKIFFKSNLNFYGHLVSRSIFKIFVLSDINYLNIL